MGTSSFTLANDFQGRGLARPWTVKSFYQMPTASPEHLDSRPRARREAFVQAEDHESMIAMTQGHRP